MQIGTAESSQAAVESESGTITKMDLPENLYNLQLPDFLLSFGFILIVFSLHVSLRAFLFPGRVFDFAIC